MSVDFIFDYFKSLFPNPKTELCFHNNFTLLIAVMLSAQTTDKQVNIATSGFFNEIESPEDVLAKGESWLLEGIKTINYNKTKAKNIIKTCQILVEKFNSQIPSNLEDLNSLPGVGRKTANVVLNCGFGLPTIPVDTHCMRVANRLGFSESTNPLKIELDLLKIIPSNYLLDAHHYLVLFGRYNCKAQKPNCKNCKISSSCKYFLSI